LIVKRGTPYPTKEPVARITVKASHDDQTQLGILIYELGEVRTRCTGESVELVFDPSGAARVVQVSPDEQDRRTRFCINESAPTFLKADPPARAGEPRFEVTFGIDGNKRLLITARDLQTGRITHRDFPVVKLT
jgi:molecular chaperone DnaK (HSP70)